MAAVFPPPSSWWFLPAVLVVLLLFLGVVWMVAVAASRRAGAAWPAYGGGVGRCGLRLLPFNEGAGDDEDDTEDPLVREARHRILNFGRSLSLLRAASASVQPITVGSTGGLWACAFNLRFRSSGSRFNAWVSDKTVVGVAGPWRLPRFVILPRGAGASFSRAFDAVDYELDDVTESPLPKSDGLANHYRLLAFERGGAITLPRALLDWLATHSGMTVEADQGCLIVFRGNRPLGPDALASLLQDACDLGQALVPATGHSA